MTAALLERYLAGEVTALERADVEAWLARDQRRALVVDALQAGPPRVGSDLGAQWRRLEARRLTRSGTARDLRPTSPPRAPSYFMRRRAARQMFVRGMLCLIATVTSGLYMSRIVTRGTTQAQLQQIGHLYLSTVRAVRGQSSAPLPPTTPLTHARTAVETAAARTADLVSQGIAPYRTAMRVRDGML